MRRDADAVPLALQQPRKGNERQHVAVRAANKDGDRENTSNRVKQNLLLVLETGLALIFLERLLVSRN